MQNFVKIQLSFYSSFMSLKGVGGQGCVSVREEDSRRVWSHHANNLDYMDVTV